MIVPTIHSGGTPREELLRRIEESAGGLAHAMMVMREHPPEARDYPSGADALAVAQGEHRERLRRIEAVYDELERMCLAIQDG